MVSTHSYFVVSVHLMWRVLLCLGLSLSAFNAHADKSATESLSHLFTSTESHHYQFSPNGKFVAYIDSQSPLNAIAISKIHRSKQTQRIVLKQGKPEKLHWLSNTVIAYESQGRLFSIDRTNMTHKTLLGNVDYVRPRNRLINRYDNAYREWRVVNTLAHDPEHVIVAATDLKGSSYIYRYNFVGNELQELANGRSGGITNWIVAHNGEVSLGLINEKGRETYLAKSNNRWSQRKGASLMFNFDGESYLDRRAIFEGVSYNEDVVYISENFNTDKFRLVAYSLSENKPLHVILEDQRYDIGGDDNPIQLMFNEQTQQLAGVHYHRDKPHSVWFDKTLIAMQRSLDTRFPQAINRIESWTPNMHQVLVKSYDDAARHKVYLYYPFQQKLKLLSDLSANTNHSVVSTKAHRFTARDGYELEAYLTTPANHSGDAMPLVVIPHGGPWARDTWGYDAQSQFFASQGYATLKVNFRGSRGYGLTHLKAGVGELAGLMIDDIADGAYWAIKNNIANPNKVFIMGTSYGGYAALMSGVRYPELYKGVVSNAAPIDLLDQFEHFEENELSFAYNYWSKAVGDPSNQEQFLEQISPKQHLAQLDLPTLIYHGEKDETVPVWQAKLAEKQLTRNDKAQVVIVEDEGHGFSQISNRLDYLNAAVTLFNSAAATQL